MLTTRKVRFSIRSLAIMLLTFTSASAFAQGFYLNNEVIVKYKTNMMRTNQMMNSLYNDVFVEKVKHYKGQLKNIEQLTLANHITVDQAIEILEKNPMVEYVQPNYILSLPETYMLGRNLADVTPKEGFPCIPGFEIPGCDPSGTLPCIFPGIPFPPGCDGGGGGGTPPPPPKTRPELKDPPADVNPPVADPDLSKTYGLSKTEATEAWKEFRGSKEFIVADIDTGIDYNHQDLAFNVWRNPNPKNNDIVGYDFIHNDGLPYDDQGHGTHTAGTIGAVGGNGVAISGVSQRVSIMALKFLSAEGSGTTADAIRAIDYAVEHGARVLSNSWGGKGDEDNKALREAIDRAKNANVLFIAAAGNDGTDNDGRDPSYPAAFDNDNLIAVAATDNKDGMAFFSNYGKKTTHLGAPGVDVYSTIPGDKYKAYSGTSMACPHVAGAAALVWAKNPTWDYKKVKEVLMKTVDAVPSLNGKTITGGRLNVLRALRSTE